MTHGADLIATCWTIAGDVDPTTDRNRSPYALGRRIEAAAAVGYGGIGLWHGDLVKAIETIGYRELRVLLESNGMRHVELEHLTDWFADGERRRRSDAVRRDLFAAADALGARHIKVMPPFGKRDWPEPRLIDEFSTLCAEAARHGVLIAMEMVPFSKLTTLDATLAVVAGADAPNGGLLLDIWHVVRSGASFDDVRRIPARYILAAEIDDADLAVRGDMFADTNHHRKFCGEGAFDVPGFIAAMRDAGYAGPWGVEILSDEVRRMPLEMAAHRSFATARAQFG